MNLVGNVKAFGAKVFGATAKSGTVFNKSPAELALIQENLQNRLEAYAQIREHLTTPEWQWLTTVFLPVRITELSKRQRQEIRPEDAQGNLRFAGRFDELEDLSGYLADVQGEISVLNNELKRVNQAMEIAQRKAGT